MQQTINPDKQTVESCLKQRSYYIDFYQREYIWTQQTVEILLNDIFYSFELSYEEHKNEELTQGVLGEFNWYYLNIFITNNINGKVYIVDGQQRLSTLTLIATKLYHLTNDEFLKDTLKDCIFGKDKWEGNIFRIDHEKRKDVMESILYEKDFTCEYHNKTEETIINRYKDISIYINKKQMDAKKLDAFIKYFLDRLVLVELTISKDDTPMVFEVINDRGEPLKPFEILKGKLIGALSKSDTDNYSQKWDADMSLLLNNEDNFFTDIIKSKYIFKRNSKVETMINNAYHRYIFDHNDIAVALSFRKSDKDHIANIKDFIDNDIRYYSKLYSKIIRNDDIFLRYNNDIHSLSGQYQIILSACSIDDKEEEIKIHSIAKEYDRLHMLLRLNGVYDSNSFQEITYNLNEKIKNANISVYRSIFDTVIIEQIKERKNLNEVKSILEYENYLKKDYTNMDTRSLRYFLARIESYICEKNNRKMQNDVMYISTKTGWKTGYHIEHILSRNSTNENYFDSQEDFESKRNLLGGLLLLKDRDNISSGNEEYAEKLKTYSSGLVWGHTLCESFYHKNKDFEDFNREIEHNTGYKFSSIKAFGKDALEYRSKLLYELIKLIWEVQ
jgi:uncharacterized protein with ParB-like and HNH nuclease domain